MTRSVSEFDREEIEELNKFYVELQERLDELRKIPESKQKLVRQYQTLIRAIDYLVAEAQNDIKYESARTWVKGTIRTLHSTLKRRR